MTVKIDHDKLQAAIRKMGNEYVYYMLADALELLPPSKMEKLVGRYLDLKSIQATGPDPKEHLNLLAETKAFEKASRAGKYYESFCVNSKNYREMSRGTRAWIAECDRLLNICVGAVHTVSTKGQGRDSERIPVLRVANRGPVADGI